MGINYKRRYNNLLHDLKKTYNNEILTNNIVRCIIMILDLISILRRDKSIWTKDLYYQKICILEDNIFNKTTNNHIIDKCIIVINKYKII